MYLSIIHVSTKIVPRATLFLVLGSHFSRHLQMHSPECHASGELFERHRLYFCVNSIVGNFSHGPPPKEVCTPPPFGTEGTFRPNLTSVPGLQLSCSCPILSRAAVSSCF